MRTRILAWTLALAVLFPASADALRVQQIARLGNAEGSQRVALVPLTNGGFVAAWDDADSGMWRATARVFDDQDAVVGEDLLCMGSSPLQSSSRAQLVRVQSGFVLGCETYRESAITWSATHLHRFDNRGATVGAAIHWNTRLITQLDRLIEMSGENFAAETAECDSEGCRYPRRIYDASTQAIGVLPIPRIRPEGLGVVPVADHRLLAVGYGPLGSGSRSTLMARRVSETGVPLERVTKLGRLLVPSSPSQLVKGGGGRIAALWFSVAAAKNFILNIQMFDARGVPEGPSLEIEVPKPAEAWAGPLMALPLRRGFLVLWTPTLAGYREGIGFGRFPKTLVQAYQDSGDPIGSPAAFPDNAGGMQTAVYLESEDAYILASTGQGFSGNGEPASLWRLTMNSLCADVDGDLVVTTADAQRVARAAADLESCALCLCDLDDTGVVDGADVSLALRIATGSSAPEQCPVCSAQE